MKHNITQFIEAFESNPIPITLSGKDYIINKIENQFIVFPRLCPHANGDLLKATTINWQLTCMNHGLCFDLRSGKLITESLDVDILENINNTEILKLKIDIYNIMYEDNKWYVSI